MLGSFDRCSSPVCGCLCTHARRTCIGMFPRCRRRTVRGCGRSGCACTCSEEASAGSCTSARSVRSGTVRECRPRKARACPCTGRSDDGCRRSGEASPHPDILVRSTYSIRLCHSFSNQHFPATELPTSDAADDLVLLQLGDLPFNTTQRNIQNCGKFFAREFRIFSQSMYYTA